jgi:perosamine synthetase
MQAALGLAQLERVEELITRKRQIFAWYHAELTGLDGVTLNYEAPGTKNTYWMVTVVLDKKYGLESARLMGLFSQENIDCRPFFHPLSSLPAYAKLEQAREARKRNHVSYALSPYGLNLPSGMNITAEKAKSVCDTLKAILHRTV